MVQRKYQSESGFALRLEGRVKNDALVNARGSLHLTALEANLFL